MYRMFAEADMIAKPAEEEVWEGPGGRRGAARLREEKGPDPRTRGEEGRGEKRTGDRASRRGQAPEPDTQGSRVQGFKSLCHNTLRTVGRVRGKKGCAAEPQSPGGPGVSCEGGGLGIGEPTEAFTN